MITILLATKNSEKYLDKQLEALLDQTFKETRIIIRDGGSTDSTKNIIEKYREIYHDKIEICPSCEDSKTSSESFYRMLEEYSDDYIMLCEEGEIWHPENVKNLFDAIKSAESRFSKDTPLLIYTNQQFSIRNSNYLEPTLNRLLFNNIPPHSTLIINRTLKDKLYIFQNSTPCKWWLAIIAVSLGKIFFLKTPNLTIKKQIKNPVIKKAVFEWKTAPERAEFLLKNYENLLSMKQKKLLISVLSFPNLSLLNKIKTVIKYGLFL